MSFVKDVIARHKGTPGPTVPPDVQQQIDQPNAAVDPFGRLADVYQQSFGSATEGGALVAVPVNPQQQGGGVAYLAHIGGFIAGLILSFFFRRPLKANRSGAAWN